MISKSQAIVGFMANLSPLYAYELGLPGYDF